MGEQDTMTEVPAALKRLAKYMVRGFYGLEYSLALDVLIRYSCVKEEDIALLLKFEKKQLRTILQMLKADKFVKSRIRLQTGPNGKSTKHIYYYINYKVLVDVTKYKLDHIRRKIESDERETTNRASFRCPGCSSTYSDLEVNQLFDSFTGLFRCTYCNLEVEEVCSSLPKRDSRTLLAKFNEQIEPIFLLLRETEDIVLPSELLEPQPTEIPELFDSCEQVAASQFVDHLGHQGRWANKSSATNMYVQSISINVNEPEVKKVKEKKGKEQPIWMKESTVYESLPNVNTSVSHEGPENIDENSTKKGSSADNEVFRTLLIHEMKTTSGPNLPQVSKTDSESDTSESDEEKKRTKVTPTAPTNHAEQEEEDVDPVVMVGGQLHVYSEVSQNPALVSFMNDEEREAYIKIGQQMFQSVFE